MDITNDLKLLEWLDTIEAKDATRSSYLTHMKKFCECVGKTPTELINDSIIEVKEGKLPAERNAKGYVAKFKKCLSDAGYAPKSQQSALAALKSFFKSYDMPLSQSIARSKKAQVLEANTGFMTREDVIKLVTNAKNLREKAIFLCMATSGMAIREIIDLRIGEIEIDAEGIGTIRIRREKTQTDYTTFISPEATIALKNYWDERSRDAETKIKGKDDFVFVSYGNRSKGKQLNLRTLSHLFNILGKQLGYGNGKGFIKSRSHFLRKYCSSTLEDNGFPKPKVDFMIGHTVSDIDKAYFNRDPSKLKELYKTFLPYLTFEKEITVRSLNTEDTKKLEELKNENLQLKDKMDRQELDFRIKMESVERKLDVLSLMARKREDAYGFASGDNAEAWEPGTGNIAIYKRKGDKSVKIGVRKPTPKDYAPDNPLLDPVPAVPLSQEDQKRASEFMKTQKKLVDDLHAKGGLTATEKARKLIEKLKKEEKEG
ncbi:MAG: hypothetical protein D4R88_02780 [Methanosarcinales archaeon]|nr:MAG: hypothetical protein D4R88_02780 [Methanosarcinales archaeon]